MRTELEVADFESASHYKIVQRCKKCDGKEPTCSCVTRHRLIVNAYEACVPRDFWFIKPEDISHNTRIFKEVVTPYCQRVALARVRGYGLALLGDNGVGKTMFMSYVLMKAITAGYTAYYTTLPNLDWNMKRSFNVMSIGERLHAMLTSDFLAIDEMGKEKFRAGDTYMRMQVERILKERFDDSMPTLIATNGDLDAIEAAYGTTISSILRGKYRVVTMEPGDFRKQLSEKMAQEMGYND